MPACEPTDEKLRRKNYKAIGLGTKVALFVIRRPAHTSLSERFPVPSLTGPCFSRGAGTHQRGAGITLSATLCRLANFPCGLSR